jgi:hypothetical protein
MRHANGDVVAFLDDDAATGPGWLRSLTGLAIHALPQARVIANGYDRGERGVRKTGMRHAGDDIVELLEAC